MKRAIAAKLNKFLKNGKNIAIFFSWGCPRGNML
jgi:hypothetical protein